MSSYEYGHVDVFSRTPFSGNSLAVFPDARGLSTDQRLRITQELRHFESIFLEPTGTPGAVRAQVFDLFSELPFAGHPILGAAAYLHRRSARTDLQTWRFELPTRTVTVTTERTDAGHFGWLDQGPPEFFAAAPDPEQVARSFALERQDLHPELPLAVVSTGLRYLIVPVVPGALSRARAPGNLTPLMRELGADFAVLLDEAALEVRHWNNEGGLEDVATGSAAGTVGAYRLRQRLAKPGEAFLLHQGRFAGRPSTLRVQAVGTPAQIDNVRVGGDVVAVGRGTLEVLP